MTLPASAPTATIEPQIDVLIHRIKDGEAMAFDLLYQQYTPRLMAYLHAQLEHAYLAEEVCQDVWMVVWQKADQFHFRSRFSTWLFGIAQRLVWKARSRRVNAPAEMLPVAEEEITRESPEMTLTQQGEHQRVMAAIASLPPKMRQAVTLSYYHGRTYREIASHLGCAENTVKSQLHQAKRLLAVKLRRSECTLTVAV